MRKYWDIKTPNKTKKVKPDTTAVTVVLRPGDIVKPNNRALQQKPQKAVDVVIR